MTRRRTGEGDVGRLRASEHRRGPPAVTTPRLLPPPPRAPIPKTIPARRPRRPKKARAGKRRAYQI